jgi:YbbR domain-containing protein
LAVVKEFIQNIGDKIETINKRNDRRPLIFLASLVIASVLWLVNVMGKTFETEVSMPINYTNLPQEVVMVNQPTEALQVRIEAHGFTLLRNRLRLSFYPINFNMKAFLTHIDGARPGVRHHLPSNRFHGYIAKQIGSEISIVSIFPDTLYFEFDKVVEKKKPVKGDFELTFAKQYFLYDSIKFEPDSIMVRGPQKMLDTLSFVKTEKRKYKNLNANQKRKVKLAENEQLKFDRKTVEAYIPVSIFSEYTANVPINVINIPDSLSMVTFPGSVKVTCQVAVPDYGNINPSNFLFVVDYEQLLAGVATLSVNHVHAPFYVRKLSFTPHEVEYIIERK